MTNTIQLNPAKVSVSNVTLNRLYMLFEVSLVTFHHCSRHIKKEKGKESQKVSLPRGLSCVKKRPMIAVKDFFFRCDYPANNYLFKVKNRKIRKRCEICSKLTLRDSNMTSLSSFWCFYC